MDFKENFFSFLGKCLVMLSMTSMTAGYATASSTGNECMSSVTFHFIITLEVGLYAFLNYSITKFQKR